MTYHPERFCSSKEDQPSVKSRSNSRLRELWQVVAGEVPGRTEADDITLFKSLGMALWDVVAAKAVYEKAVTRGVGTTLDW